VIALVLLALTQSARCDTALAAARADVVRLDPARAEALLDARRREGCDVELALIYLRGLMAARAAYAKGGDAASLAPVQSAIAAVGERAELGAVAETVGFVLRAAMAAAQSERGELSVMLAQALQVERSLGARGQPGAPLLSAHEMAGELWLQVHRYEEAVAAYRVARAYAGDSPRLTVGLARALARQKETRAACEEYARLAKDAPALRPRLQGELDEAAQFLRQPVCRPPARR
jgi:hypothetical protein